MENYKDLASVLYAHYVTQERFTTEQLVYNQSIANVFSVFGSG